MLNFGRHLLKVLRRWYIEKDDNDSIPVIQMLQTGMRPKRKFTSTITNWITRLEGFIAIYSKMKGFGFKNIFSKTFNQDPTVTAFTPFYKSLLVNNYSKGNSEGSNCENNEGNILVSLKRFVQQDVVEVQPVLHSNEDIKITEILENRRILKQLYNRTLE